MILVRPAHSRCIPETKHQRFLYILHLESTLETCTRVSPLWNMLQEFKNWSCARGQDLQFWVSHHWRWKYLQVWDLYAWCVCRACAGVRLRSVACNPRWWALRTEDHRFLCPWLASWGLPVLPIPWRWWVSCCEWMNRWIGWYVDGSVSSWFQPHAGTCRVAFDRPYRKSIS